MALIKCPECGNQFSDLAECCPQCGYPTEEIPSRSDEIKKDSIEEGQQEDIETKQKEGVLKQRAEDGVDRESRHSPSFARFMVVGALIALVVLYVALIHKPNDSDSGGSYLEDQGYYGPSNPSSTKSNSQSYSWIVGTWYVQTPYGTTSIRFEGDGSKGDVTELEDALNPYSAKYGTYYVENDILYYNLRGEPGTSYIEIHSGQRLYMGGGYYYKKINQ